MKKVVLCGVILAMVLTCGCVNKEAIEQAKKTRVTVAAGDYMQALDYGELAITKGYRDDDFVDLVENLRNYKNAKIALNGHDVTSARVYVNAIDDPEECGMQNAVVELNVEIAKLEEELKKVEEKMKDLNQAFWDGKYLYVINEAETLFKNRYLSDEKKSEVLSLKEKAQAKLEGGGTTGVEIPSPTSVGSEITQQRAIELARKELSMSSSATVNVTDGGSYYMVSFTEYIQSGGETIESGAACKIDKKTGKAYDHVG